jgi:tRNA threonylcarbamoyladenosine biosynthesis protein TsaE
MATRSFVTDSPSNTRALGRILGEEVRQYFNPSKTALVFALTGDLGSGKTVFSKGFAKGLGVKHTITSPTFVLAKRYYLTRSPFKNFWHVDCYRFEKPSELKDIDFKKIMSESTNVLVIEWADRIPKALPKKIVKIRFEHISLKVRKITFHETR